jgi:hypothetical protein
LKITGLICWFKAPGSASVGFGATQGWVRLTRWEVPSNTVLEDVWVTIMAYYANADGTFTDT